MATFTAKTPSLSDIGASQDLHRNLRRQEAKDHFYKAGNRWHFWGSAVAIVLALVSPLVLVFEPTWGPTLGAAAGAWIFLSRLLFEPLKQGYQEKGAAAQELFDCDVLGLPWNDALVKQPAAEEIRSASKGFNEPKSVEKHSGWYPTDADTPWPQSVIVCQRSNAVWARRQHHAYARLLILSAFVWLAFGILLSALRGATLVAYLTTIALPSLPAALDAIDAGKKHFAASNRRQDIEDKANALCDSDNVTHADLRELQDQIFALRRDAPPVAEWFYKLHKRTYETDMRYAASENITS